MSRLHKIYLGNKLPYSLCSHPNTPMFSRFVTWSVSQTNLKGSYYALFPRSLIDPPCETTRNLALKASKTTCRGQSYRKTGKDSTCCQNTSAASTLQVAFRGWAKICTISSTPTLDRFIWSVGGSTICHNFLPSLLCDHGILKTAKW